MRFSFRQDQPHNEAKATARHRRRQSTDADATRSFQRSDTIDMVPSQSLPWIRFGLIAIGVLLVITLIWQLLTMGRIHAYGIVRSQIEALQAPTRVRIGGLYVQPGDQVSAGDTLYVLVSDEAQREADRVQALIREAELELQDFRQRLEQLTASPQIDDLQNIQAIRERQTRLQRERDQVAVDHDNRSHRLIREIKLLQFQLAQRQAALEEAGKQREAVEMLAAVEAATADDLARHRSAERRAAEAVTETRTKLTQFEGELAALERDTQRERERLEKQVAELKAFQNELHDTVAAESERLKQATSSAIQRTEAKLTALREEYAHHKRQAGPNAVRASSAGMILDVSIADGAEIGVGSDILRLAHTGEIWIDAYLPTEDASAVGPESAILIERLDGGESIPGNSSRSGAMEVGMPGELVALNPGQTRATRMRIDIGTNEHGLNPGNIVQLVIEP